MKKPNPNDWRPVSARDWTGACGWETHHYCKKHERREEVTFQPDVFVNPITRNDLEHVEWVCCYGDGIVVTSELHGCFSGPVQRGNGGEELFLMVFIIFCCRRLEFSRRGHARISTMKTGNSWVKVIHLLSLSVIICVKLSFGEQICRGWTPL